MAAQGGQRAIIAAFFANLGIAIAKFVGFVVTGSASLLAEAIHSVADTSNQGLLLLGGRRARLAPTTEHPFGYGRERYFWSFIVALVLFLLGGIFSMFEGVEKLRHPHEIESFLVAVVILAVAIVFEVFSLRVAVNESNAVRGQASWWQFVRRSRTPELPVVLLEDLGALLGLVLALVGVVLAEVTGEARWDALGSIAIGVLLVVIAIVLMVEMKSLLIGESATTEHVAAIRSALEGGPNVRRLLELRTQHLGPDELLVAAKVELAAGLTFDDVVASIDAAERQVRERVAIAEHVYVEPDLPDQ